VADAWQPGAKESLDGYLLSLEAGGERHRAEVLWVLGLRAAFGLESARRYIEQVRKRRGDEAAARLRDDATQQWALGSRGAPGDWRAA
jgi:hypothetical protein